MLSLGREFDMAAILEGRENLEMTPAQNTLLLYREGKESKFVEKCPGVGNLALVSMKMSNSPGSVRPLPTLGLNIDSALQHSQKMTHRK